MPDDNQDSSLIRVEHAVARSLAETEAAEEVYPAVLGAIGHALGWSLGSVWETPAGEGRSMSCRATWHANGSGVGDFEEITRSASFERGIGLPGRVWESGEPAWIRDVTTDPNFPRAPAAIRAGLHAAFCFPLRSQRGILGAIEFFTTELREPDPGLLASVASLGSQIGQFVERRRAEQAVRASDQLKRAMLEAALDCVITMDHRGCVLDFNPAAERTFGYRAADVIGKDMADLIVPPSLRPAHRHGLARHLETGKAAVLDRRIEITAMRASGEEFPVELTITRIDVPGTPTFTGYVRDITDRKQAERELRESRARIVAAGDAERRRLERDLHDGAQQRLVSLALSLRLARARLDGRDVAAAELLDDAMEDLAQATLELRDLARGIHPAVLSAGGLAPALGMLTSRSTVPAKLEGAPEGRLPAPVETAAYFLVCEALTNVARYAEAGHAVVSVRQSDGTLVVEVSDDGRGGADPASGSGLRGLADRIGALDGTFEVLSPPGGGTRVYAEIPCVS